MNTASKSAFKKYMYSVRPSKDQTKIMQFLLSENRPVTLFEISEATSIPIHYMGQIVCKDLIELGKVFRVEGKTGVSPSGNFCTLVISKQYLDKNPDYLKIIEDSDNSSRQKELFK